MIALKIMDAAINWIYNKVKYEYNKFKYFHNIGNYLNSILSKFKIFISYISSNIIESNYVYYLSIEECFFNTSNIEDIRTLYIENINCNPFLSFRNGNCTLNVQACTALQNETFYKAFDEYIYLVAFIIIQTKQVHINLNI